MMLEDISEEELSGEVERAERKQLDKLHLLCSLFGEPKHSYMLLPKKTSEHAGEDTYSQEETIMVRKGQQQKQLHWKSLTLS
jgi:hypothetical protein